MSLFSTANTKELSPLAERSRPASFDRIRGQKHFLSDKSPLFSLLKNKQLMNLILWGPPGTGKTTLALNIARATDAHFIQLNAVDSGVKDLKAACEEGRDRRQQYQLKTILFVDEIHRFNKSQQDVLLPYLEKGDIYLIGATTELPSYELNKALISRCQVIELKKLSIDDLKDITEDIFKNEGLAVDDVLKTETVITIINLADGDARRLINILDNMINVFKLGTHQDLFPLSESDLEQFSNQKIISYDKKSDQHYDTISAFIKSMRGSDPDAALYYCARMLIGGEDPVFIARRMIIFASEDIGNADPRALPLAVACLQAVEAIGMPECRINLGHVITFLASCPKSNSSYLGINKAMDYVKQNSLPDVPLHLKSSSYAAKDKYMYPHNYDKGYVKQSYWPEGMNPEKFYEPKNIGFEKNISEYLNWMKGSS